MLQHLCRSPAIKRYRVWPSAALTGGVLAQHHRDQLATSIADTRTTKGRDRMTALLILALVVIMRMAATAGWNAPGLDPEHRLRPARWRPALAPIPVASTPGSLRSTR